MELKVWVEGVVRVVCGLSLNTSCQEVVITLAQAIGQTGRYILILKFRGNERQLVADDCPLQHLAHLGQLAAEVQFILRRTGPSLSAGQETPTTERRLPLPRPSEPETLRRREPQKSLTFNLGHATYSKGTKPNRSVHRASPEPRASPVSFLDAPDPLNAVSPHASTEDVFRKILQQQRRLQDLEVQLQALEKETQGWERGGPSPVPCPSPDAAEELEELQWRLRQNEAELMSRGHWDEKLQTETDREQEMNRRLQQIHSSVVDQSHEIKELAAHSAHLEHDIQLTADRQSSQEAARQQEEALGPLREELHNRHQHAEEVDATLSGTQRELHAADSMLQDRWELVEELNKELRQCNLQQFIQQTGAPPAEQTNSLLVPDLHLSSAGVIQ
ncbi:ras association domain-containing protein 7-like isoform X1 [Limanda limanda]|uniref:ras association domain-containing protein 7-like isoform X1 n=1 Tax=Limanda limanda TaxID=27771 RepID=UPI0029C65B3D|nr:ras association domain-containing protein 7-like isoform X1 [Limanda limanda]XP_060923568.1 ras association domain-containing protein 7-like isoform X1 [Limanda limanda]XP_060923569.1 ras association domain-containing protein 7-like isoform X1 [Limanda limanda]